MWDNLLELTHLNSSKGSRITSLVDRCSSGKQKSLSLYQQLLQGKLHQSRFNQLHQNDQSSSDLQVLQEELIHTYFFSNLERSGFNDRKSAEVECWKNWVAVKMLFGKSAMVFPQKTCLKILKQADRYGFHKLIIEIAKQLRLYYGAQLGDSKRFKKYDELIRQHRKKHQQAKKTGRQLNFLKLSYLLNGKGKQEVLAQTKHTLKELSAVTEEERSFSFGYNQHLIMLVKHTLEKDLPALDLTCKEAIKFTSKTLKHHQGNEDRIFHLASAFTFMKQGDFANGIKAMKKMDSLEKKGTPLWFENMGFKFIMAIHTGQYHRALVLLKEVRSQSKFKLLRPEKVAKWMIFESYLNLLEETGRSDVNLKLSANKGHLGLSKSDILNLDPEGPIAVHQNIIAAVRMALHQDKEGIKKVSQALKASLCSLREKGYFRLAAFSEFLCQTLNKNITSDQLKEKYHTFKENWNLWPFLPDIQQRIYEEIVPFDLLEVLLQEKMGQSQMPAN